MPIPNLIDSQQRIMDVIKGEETRFAHTLSMGLARLDQDFDELFAAAVNSSQSFDKVQVVVASSDTDDPRQWKMDSESLKRTMLLKHLEEHGEYLVYPGEKAFKLYDTFGLPRDFIEDAARDAGILFDAAGFDAAMEEQRKRAQASWKGGGKATASPVYQALPQTKFEGYRQTRSDNCEVLAIIKSRNRCRRRRSGI